MTDTIYPTVPHEDSGGEFRLHKINDVLNTFLTELHHYEKVRKKYARTRSFCQSTAVTTGALSAAFAGTGIGTSLTGPGVVVGIPLSAVGGVLGLISAVFTVVTKTLTKKVSKHEKTIELIKSKYNSISDLVSQALRDNRIDEKEFTLIMTELNKYEMLKTDIRRKNVEEKKESPNLQKMRDDIRKEILEQLKK